MLSNVVPIYDAHVITKLRAEDTIFLGKTNMDEFAMGSTTESSYFQVTRNPWNLDRVPGGSSGGSAAAIAAGEAIWAGLPIPAALSANRLPLTARRHQTDLWPRFPLRLRSFCFVPRPDRADHPRCYRRRYRAQHHLWQGRTTILPRCPLMCPTLPRLCALTLKACASACRKNITAKVWTLKSMPS